MLANSEPRTMTDASVFLFSLTHIQFSWMATEVKTITFTCAKIHNAIDQWMLPQSDDILWCSSLFSSRKWYGFYQMTSKQFQYLLFLMNSFVFQRNSVNWLRLMPSIAEKMSFFTCKYWIDPFALLLQFVKSISNHMTCNPNGITIEIIIGVRWIKITNSNQICTKQNSDSCHIDQLSKAKNNCLFQILKCSQCHCTQCVRKRNSACACVCVRFFVRTLCGAFDSWCVCIGVKHIGIWYACIPYTFVHVSGEIHTFLLSLFRSSFITAFIRSSHINHNLSLSFTNSHFFCHDKIKWIVK